MGYERYQSISPALGDGTYRSPIGFVAAEARMNPRAVAGDARLGAWLVDFPVLADAFSAGRITRAHVQAIKSMDNPRTSAALVEAQQDLVQAAETCDWRDFNAVLRYWLLAFDPDGEEPRDQVARRYCRVKAEPDGSVTGQFHLDPVAGHALSTALEQEYQRLFAADHATDESVDEADE